MLGRSGIRAAALILVAVAGGWYLREQQPAEVSEVSGVGAPEAAMSVVLDPLQHAVAERARGVVLAARGRVERILADDRDGSPHQRFIIATNSGITLMIAHNLDLAPRLQGLAPGDVVTVLGEYEWNEKGGVMHWTHDDPQGKHAAGYIEWRGKRYQ